MKSLPDLPFLDHLLEGCQLIGPDYRYLYVNPAVAEQGRRPREMLLGRTMMDVYPGIEDTPMFAVLRRCMEERRPDRMENEFEFPDGSTGWFELRFEPVPDGLFVLSIDVTLRKRAEEALHRENRALTTLSRCNRTLVHAETEQQLVADVCRIIATQEGYRTAWASVAIDGDAANLHPVAQAGILDPRSSLGRRLGEEAGRPDGLSARAIRGRRPVLGDLGDPGSGEETRAEVATDNDLAACLALPLRHGDDTVGALLISADDSEAFDDAELHLLEELALDLGYGIASLRTREEFHRTEESRRELERQHGTLLSNLPGVAYRCRNERGWPMEVISEGCLDLTGHPPEHFTGEGGVSFSEVIHPDDRQSVWDEVQAAITADRPYVVEYRIRDAAGEIRWVWEKGTVVRARDGDAETLEGFLTDVTDRRRAESDLRATNERLQRLARVVQDLSATGSLEGVTEIVRHAARDLAAADGATFVLRDGDRCHYVDEDAIAPLWKGKKFPMSACISGWAMLERRPAVIEDISQDDRIPHDVYRETFVKSLLMLPIRTDDPVGAIGVYWAEKYRATPADVRILQALADSTSVALENLETLRQLEESRARSRAVQDHLPIPMLVWKRGDGGFRLTDFNRAARAVTGGGIEAFAGSPARELAGALPGLVEDLERCAAEGEPVQREVEAQLPGDGDRRSLLLTYGSVPGDLVVLHAEDVTERRRTEEQLRASQKLEAVGQLASGVAHDFNNLLTVILTCTDLVIDALPESHPVLDDALEVREAARRAAGLTRQLLAFGRKQILAPEVVCLNTIVSGLEGMLRRLIGEHIDVEIRLEGDLGNVEADPGQIEQVVMNLALNARDAMHRGGMLTIETHETVVDDEYVGRHLDLVPGPHVVLSVSDTGQGIDPEIRERVFDPFFTTKEKGEGTGLGLSTVYGIVKQSGGDIWLYSEPGHGTTFKVYFPRIDAPVTKQAPSSRSHSGTGGETILVVEDEPAVRQLVERILRRTDYEVLSAADGAEAVLVCEERDGAVDLLITDVVMPGMSGQELAALLVDRYPGLEVLYTSGYSDGAIDRHGLLEPGTFFIGKPFTGDDLTRKIREILSGGDGSDRSG